MLEHPLFLQGSLVEHRQTHGIVASINSPYAFQALPPSITGKPAGVNNKWPATLEITVQIVPPTRRVSQCILELRVQ